MSSKSLYERLGGYDGISGFADNFLARLQADSALGRFWQNRGDDGTAREKQLLVDFLCANSGGPMLYTGRDMLLTHKGMQISESDWTAFLGHAGDTFEALDMPQQERDDVSVFVMSLKDDIVEA